MDSITLQTLADFAGGRILQGDPSTMIPGVGTDSRQAAPGELFLALSGENFDGHRFLAQAQRSGAIGAIVHDPASCRDVPGNFLLIEVSNTLSAYQRLAASYRRTLPLKVVAITGSNGKTSTKDFTAAVLSQRYQVLKTEGNLNNHIGVPRMLLRASSHDDIAVLEMGMNHPGEIRPLAEMAKPDAAIITNIGTAHIEHMGTREAIAEEKGTLLESIDAKGCAILPEGDPFTASLVRRTAARVTTVGINQGDLQASHIRATLNGSSFDVNHDGVHLRASIRVPGEHMIVNALFAVAAGIFLGLPLEEAVRGLSATVLTKGRLELRRVGNLLVIDDSYNANPDSMTAALATLAALPCHGRRIAVLGRMGELGTHSDSGHQAVGEAAAAQKINCVISVGEEAAIIAQYAKTGGVGETHVVNDPGDAAKLLQEIADTDDLILVKGSRSARMERVIAALDPAATQHPLTH